MREAVADLFALHAAGVTIAVTTSGLVGRDGVARVGPGCARECVQRFPWFAERLGALLVAGGLRTVHVGERIVAFPVEKTPYENPDLVLIARSAHELAALADEEGWNEIALPRPGCGHGGLAWAEVGLVLSEILDHRFLIATRE
jgi:hypothetical protein